MMNWNNNDTKYIIKRIILYLLITGIVFFAGSKCAKANTISENINPPYWNYSISGTSINIPLQVNNNNQQLHVFQNQGNGYVVGTLVFYQYNTNTTTSPSTIRLGNDNEWFVCDMGNSIYWNNNNTGYTIISIKCNVTLNNNRGIKYIAIDRFYATGTLIVELPRMLSFTADSNTASTIVSSQQQAAQDQINAINNLSSSLQAGMGTHATNIINATNSASVQAHQDAQNIVSGLQQATATEQATQDYLKEDYQFDEQMINDFSIFGTNTNYLQQILMWPYNLALSLGTALSGTSCSTYSFGYLYGTELTLPCINWKQYVGNTIYVAIDTIMGMCLLFGVISFIRKAFEYVLNFGNSAYETISVEVFK